MSKRNKLILFSVMTTLPIAFNNYFNSIGETLSKTITPPGGASYQQYLKGSYLKSFFFAPSNKYEVLTVIKNMKSSSTVGVDNMCSKMVKFIANETVHPLVYSINLSLLHGVVPRLTNISKIIPIYKSDNKNILENYRPISILPTFSKVLERIVYNRLSSYLDKLNILAPSQYGFRKK